MDPLTAMIIAGTLTTAVGSIKQAQAASSAFKFNARTGTANAAGARAAAAENERRERRLGLKRMGILRVGGQTSLDLLEDAAMEEELNALSKPGDLTIQPPLIVYADSRPRLKDMSRRPAHC